MYLDDYADWFLYQLLVSQLGRAGARDPGHLRAWVDRLSYASFCKFGEDIFA